MFTVKMLMQSKSVDVDGNDPELGNGNGDDLVFTIHSLAL